MKTEILTKKIDLKTSTSIKIGPSVPYLEITDEKQLLEISKFAKKNRKLIHVLGEGTNSYFNENKSLIKKYLFIKLNFDTEIKFVEKTNFVFVDSTANTNWNILVTETVNRNLWGLENLSLIPGSVGAAPVQNIGAYGSELKNTFVSCGVFDTRSNTFKTLKNSDCKFGNRDSIFKKQKNRFIILSVKFKLSKKPKPILNYKPLNTLDRKNLTPRIISEVVIQTRTDKLPDYNIFPNSGSFFKNPKVNKKTLTALQKKYPNMAFFVEDKSFKIPIAWFIEHIINMKGVRIGNFGTYKNHSLVIVNYDALGNSKELNTYVKMIQKKLYKATGLNIEQEVNYIS